MNLAVRGKDIVFPVSGWDGRERYGTYDPPGENMAASWILCVTELCNRHQNGMGKLKIRKSVNGLSN